MRHIRKHHKLDYYVEILNNTTDPNKVVDLLDDAAHQPLSVLSKDDYEEIYWMAQAKLEEAYGE